MVVDLTQLLGPTVSLRSPGWGPRRSGTIDQARLGRKSRVIRDSLDIRDSMRIGRGGQAAEFLFFIVFFPILPESTEGVVL